MAKYNYDRSVLEGLGVGDFLNQVKVRSQHIEEASDKLPDSSYNPNKLAWELHPPFLLGKIQKVINRGKAISYVIEPFKEAGFTEFPPFRAGQYVSFEFDMGDKYVCRPYTISSSPRAAEGHENNIYEVTVADHGPGHMSEYIHKNWQEGTIVCFSAPQGKMYYEPLRDADNIMVIGVGGEGLSQAVAVFDGVEKYSLTVLNIAADEENVMARDAFEFFVSHSNGRIKYIPVILSGEGTNCEKGPLTAELIKKYITDGESGKLIDTTFILSGPEEIVLQSEKELKKLTIPDRRIRKEIHGEHPDVLSDADYPKEKAGKTYNVRVWVRGEYKDLTCPSDVSLLAAMENANIHISSDCRAGECGWCHSRLISGEYYMPKIRDKRRAADRKFGWIHPCCTYPLSDIELEVFPVH